MGWYNHGGDPGGGTEDSEAMTSPENAGRASELLLKLQVGGGQGELNFLRSRKFHTRLSSQNSTSTPPLRNMTGPRRDVLDLRAYILDNNKQAIKCLRASR